MSSRDKGRKKRKKVERKKRRKKKLKSNIRRWKCRFSLLVAQNISSSWDAYEIHHSGRWCVPTNNNNKDERERAPRREKRRRNRKWENCFAKKYRKLEWHNLRTCSRAMEIPTNYLIRRESDGTRRFCMVRHGISKRMQVVFVLPLILQATTWTKAYLRTTRCNSFAHTYTPDTVERQSDEWTATWANGANSKS